MSVSKLSSYNLAFMVICIAINMVAGQAVSMLKLPIFLDSIGTVLCAILAGPWMAVATGLLTNLLWGLLTALIAIVMLTTGGEDSLSNLQNLTIIAASPFVLIIIGLCFSIVRALSNDPALIDEKLARQASLKEAHERRVGGHGDSRGGARRKQFRAGTLNSSMTTASGAPAVPIHDIDAEDSVIGVIEVSDIQDIMEQTHDDATGVTRDNARDGVRDSVRGTAKPAAEDS